MDDDEQLAGHRQRRSRDARRHQRFAGGGAEADRGDRVGSGPTSRSATCSTRTSISTIPTGTSSSATTWRSSATTTCGRSTSRIRSTSGPTGRSRPLSRSRSSRSRRSLADATDATERTRLETALRISEAHFNAIQETVVKAPNVTYSDTMTLVKGGREVQLHFVGRGHTGGDTMVFLPEERIVFTGDFFVGSPGANGLPYMGDGFVNEWPASLDGLKALDFDVIVPGHGAPFRDRGPDRRPAGLSARPVGTGLEAACRRSVGGRSDGAHRPERARGRVRGACTQRRPACGGADVRGAADPAPDVEAGARYAGARTVATRTRPLLALPPWSSCMRPARMERRQGMRNHSDSGGRDMRSQRIAYDCRGGGRDARRRRQPGPGAGRVA